MDSVVARRYARALFALGKKRGTDAMHAYGETLADFTGALEENPEIMGFFKNPIFSADEKKAVIAKALSGADSVVSNFVELLADKDRLPVLPAIADYYGELVDEADGVMRGQVTTAMELTDARRDEIKKTLEQSAGRPLVLGFDVNPDILGGVVVTIGDKVLDSSLRAQLTMLKEQIKRGE